LKLQGFKAFFFFLLGVKIAPIVQIVHNAVHTLTEIRIV